MSKRESTQAQSLGAFAPLPNTTGVRRAPVKPSVVAPPGQAVSETFVGGSAEVTRTVGSSTAVQPSTADGGAAGGASAQPRFPSTETSGRWADTPWGSPQVTGQIVVAGPPVAASEAEKAFGPGGRGTKKRIGAKFPRPSKKVLLGIVAVLAGLLPIVVVVTTLVSNSTETDEKALDVERAEFTLGDESTAEDGGNDFSEFLPYPGSSTGDEDDDYSGYKSGSNGSSKYSGSSSSSWYDFDYDDYWSSTSSDTTGSSGDGGAPAASGPQLVPPNESYNYSGSLQASYLIWNQSASGASAAASGGTVTMSHSLGTDVLGLVAVGGGTDIASQIKSFNGAQGTGTVSCGQSPLVRTSPANFSAATCTVVATISGIPKTTALSGTVSYHGVVNGLYETQILRQGGDGSQLTELLHIDGAGRLVGYESSLSIRHNGTYTQVLDLAR